MALVDQCPTDSTPRRKWLYYPTNDLVTAPEIMFFWVARMIISGYHYRGEAPFKNVYYTGIVRDKKGRKMSKSLGNSPDPIELMKQYGADGVRVGMLLTSPAGNDLPFDEKLCEQGRNFANKIWNAFRLVQGWEVSETTAQPDHAAAGIRWFEARSEQVLADIEQSFAEFRLSEALMATYKHIWDDFVPVPRARQADLRRAVRSRHLRCHGAPSNACCPQAAPVHAVPHRGSLQPASGAARGTLLCSSPFQRVRVTPSTGSSSPTSTRPPASWPRCAASARRDTFPTSKPST